MTFKKKLLLVLSIAISFVIAQSCKDMGQIPPPPPLVLAHSSVNIALGDVAKIRITGGTPPYRVSSGGNTNRVSASIVNDSLRLQAIATGSTTVEVEDNGSSRQKAKIDVTVILFAAGQSNFSLNAGDSATTTLSGGTPPYTFSSKGDTTVALPSISGSTLKVRALAAGGSSFTVIDNGSPRLSVNITVSVASAAPVSFSAQVQPIFTNRCVNQGCHPGSGAPFPLQAGVSYNRLVSVVATEGTCAGLLRVKPGDAPNSVLIRRLDGATCGDQMPKGLTPIPQTERDLIRSWINQGAPNN